MGLKLNELKDPFDLHGQDYNGQTEFVDASTASILNGDDLDNPIGYLSPLMSNSRKIV